MKHKNNMLRMDTYGLYCSLTQRRFPSLLSCSILFSLNSHCFTLSFYLYELMNYVVTFPWWGDSCLSVYLSISHSLFLQIIDSPYLRSVVFYSQPAHSISKHNLSCTINFPFPLFLLHIDSLPKLYIFSFSSFLPFISSISIFIPKYTKY